MTARPRRNIKTGRRETNNVIWLALYIIGEFKFGYLNAYGNAIGMRALKDFNLAIYMYTKSPNQKTRQRFQLYPISCYT
jgi:hypothetical protein